MSKYAGNLELWVAPQTYALEVLIGAATYAVVAVLHMRRVRKVPLALAMKVQE
jgi:putative ABC transport system permease protein